MVAQSSWFRRRMDEAGQGIVLSSPPKCGVPVARVGLIARPTRRCQRMILGTDSIRPLARFSLPRKSSGPSDRSRSPVPRPSVRARVPRRSVDHFLLRRSLKVCPVADPDWPARESIDARGLWLIAWSWIAKAAHARSGTSAALLVELPLLVASPELGRRPAQVVFGADGSEALHLAKHVEAPRRDLPGGQADVFERQAL